MPNLLAADEPPPFEVLNPTAASAWVITCDHAANRVPRALGKLGLSDADLARHIGWISAPPPSRAAWRQGSTPGR